MSPRHSPGEDVRLWAPGSRFSAKQLCSYSAHVLGSCIRFHSVLNIKQKWCLQKCVKTIATNHSLPQTLLPDPPGLFPSNVGLCTYFPLKKLALVFSSRIWNIHKLKQLNVFIYTIQKVIQSFAQEISSRLRFVFLTWIVHRFSAFPLPHPAHFWLSPYTNLLPSAK